MRHPFAAALALLRASGAFAGCGSEPTRWTTSLSDAGSAITVTLDDLTGRIQGIDLVSPLPDWAGTTALKDFSTKNGAPKVVWLTWTSGTCPTNVSVRATADGDRTVLAFDPGTRCQSDAGKARVLAIGFKEPTDASSIVVTATAVPSAPHQSRGADLTSAARRLRPPRRRRFRY